MAKIEPWEQRIRENMQKFADQANSMYEWIFMTHYSTPVQPGEEIPDIDEANDPNWPQKLLKFARELYDIRSSILGTLIADEDGDEQAFREAVQVSADFVDGTQVRLSIRWRGDQIYRTRDLKAETPFRCLPAFVSADWLLDYLTQYKDAVHLGVCRTCSKVYVKPKHGQKMRYCSSSCRQKAYRQRKKEADG